MRVVVLLVVLPLRMARDALVVAGRVLRHAVLRPAGRALAWLGRAALVRPCAALWRRVLVPAGRAPARLGTGWSSWRAAGCTGGS
ncbi:hypothetical protein GCM10020295_55030 [Streptomyces cinereospinus]